MLLASSLLFGVPGSLIFPLDMISGTIQYSYGELGCNSVFMVSKCTSAVPVAFLLGPYSMVIVIGCTGAKKFICLGYWLGRAIFSCEKNIVRHNSKINNSGSFSDIFLGNSISSFSKPVMCQKPSFTSCSSKTTSGSVIYLALGDAIFFSLWEPTSVQTSFLLPSSISYQPKYQLPISSLCFNGVWLAIYGSSNCT